MEAHEEQPRKTYNNLMGEVVSAIARKRRTLRVVETPRFCQAYTVANAKSREEVETLIIKDDQVGLERWMRDQLHQEYSALNIRELRVLAQSFGIPHYNRLPKSSLLSEIVIHAKESARASA